MSAGVSVGPGLAAVARVALRARADVSRAVHSARPSVSAEPFGAVRLAAVFSYTIRNEMNMNSGMLRVYVHVKVIMPHG